ncbi:MAG: cysteate synthase [Bacteroidetes bacterium]|nr:MAG: cysteate synthase [Bacteroidota bacterium]
MQSIATGNIYEDKGWTLDPINEDNPSLIRAIYTKKQIEFGDISEGVYRFIDWLPIHKKLKGSYAPITYKSEGLANKLGLSSLYITFSGYWPEKGIKMNTCSFKETESYSVGARLASDEKRILTVASAGNTARAFAQVCSDNNIPLLLCVPEDNLSALWFNKPLNDNVKLIVSETGGDYFDAINLSNIACELDEFLAEGGAKNVARRDGMATTVLSAVDYIGSIPEFYFQAVGSGTGAIAAWESNLRLIEDGRFGNTKMKLMISQNIPFHPIHDAWKADSREILPMDDNSARKQVEEIIAKVLSNRKPPYPIIGGLYDAMKDNGGDVLLVDNKKLEEAKSIFNELEGNDIHPAAAVAVGSLIQAVKDGIVKKDSTIMLNITGGGEERFKKDNELFYLKPLKTFPINPNKELVFKELRILFNL